MGNRQRRPRGKHRTHLVGASISELVRIATTALSVDIFAKPIILAFLIIAAAAATIDRSELPIVK